MNTTNTEQSNDQEHIKQPDEQSGILVESKIKIFDPETEEVYLEGRA